MASRDDWKTAPIEDPVPMTPPQRVWTDQEWSVIRRGLVPASMDDRWFAFAEGDTLHMFRSWSGLGVYRARFQRAEDGWVIAEAVAERRHQDLGMLETVIQVIIDGPVDDGWRVL